MHTARTPHVSLYAAHLHAQVSSFLLSDASNHASSLSVRRAAPPTATEHDLRVAWPDLRASQSACDVLAAQTWHLRVALAADADAAEVYLEIEASPVHPLHLRPRPLHCPSPALRSPCVLRTVHPLTLAPLACPHRPLRSSSGSMHPSRTACCS